MSDNVDKKGGFALLISSDVSGKDGLRCLEATVSSQGPQTIKK